MSCQLHLLSVSTPSGESANVKDTHNNMENERISTQKSVWVCDSLIADFNGFSGFLIIFVRIWGCVRKQS